MNKTVIRTIEILQYISENKDNANISEICRKLMIPKSSAFDIIYTLIDLDILNVRETDHVNQKYFELSTKLFQISNKFLSQNDLFLLAYPILESLSKQSGETTYLTIRDGKNIVYLLKFTAESSLIPNIQVGDTNNLYSTCEGKAFLSCMRELQINELLAAGPFEQNTKSTITSYNDLFKELSNSRKQGYTTDICESNDDALCVAAPVIDVTNNVVCSISIVSFYNRHDLTVLNKWGNLVNDSAFLLSKKLGYSFNDFYNKMLESKD